MFATVRHRTVRTKGALSQKTAKLMVFTLVRAASKTWRKLNGTNQLPRVIEGVKFTDGVATATPPKTAPPDHAASPKFSHSGPAMASPARLRAHHASQSTFTFRHARLTTGRISGYLVLGPVSRSLK